MGKITTLILLSACSLFAQADFTLLTIEPRVAAGGYTIAGDATKIEWLKADALSLSDDDPVSTWTASTGNDATQSGGNRPTFKTAIKNGLPAVRFSAASSHYMNMADLASQSQPFTVFLVVKTDGDNGTYIVGPNTTAAGRDIRVGLNPSTDLRAYAGGADLVTFLTHGSTWHIIQLVFNGASSTYRVDGGTRTTFSASPGADVFRGFMLGAYPTPGFYGSCDIGEIIVFSDGDTANEAARFTELNTKWAVY